MSTEPNTGVELRTAIEDGACYVHLDDLIEWIGGLGDVRPDEVIEFLREAGQLWLIELEFTKGAGE